MQPFHTIDVSEMCGEVVLSQGSFSQPYVRAVVVFVPAKLMLSQSRPNLFFCYFLLPCRIFSFIFVACFRTYSPCICISGYWRSSKMLFHGQNFCLSSVQAYMVENAFIHPNSSCLISFVYITLCDMRGQHQY